MDKSPAESQRMLKQPVPIIHCSLFIEKNPLAWRPGSFAKIKPVALEIFPGSLGVRDFPQNKIPENAGWAERSVSRGFPLLPGVQKCNFCK